MTSASHIKLSELTALLSGVINAAFSARSFWVVADVTSHSFREQKGYHAFDLVEKDVSSNNLIARVAAKAWGQGTANISRFEKLTGQSFGNNIHVLLQVKLNYHSLYGVSVQVLDIDSNFTLGQLEQQRRDTLAKLLSNNDFIRKEGDRYITFNAQLTLPLVIQNIALVASRNSAGVEDFEHSLNNSVPGYKFNVDQYHTAVQGESNAAEFLAALIAVYNSGIRYDAVVITRGGGAQTDLLMFDNYNIGRAIAKFPIPIITGIGHQRNESIADLMAHTATKTPTKAAEFIIAHNLQFEERLMALQRNMLIKSQQALAAQFQLLTAVLGAVVGGAQYLLGENKNALNSRAQHIFSHVNIKLRKRDNELNEIRAKLTTLPAFLLRSRNQELTSISGNLIVRSESALKSKHTSLEHLSLLVRLMTPQNIMRKGFAVLRSEGKLCQHPEHLAPGDSLEVYVQNVKLTTKIERNEENDRRDFNL